MRPKLKTLPSDKSAHDDCWMKVGFILFLCCQAREGMPVYSCTTDFFSGRAEPCLHTRYYVCTAVFPSSRITVVGIVFKQGHCKVAISIAHSHLTFDPGIVYSLGILSVFTLPLV